MLLLRRRAPTLPIFHLLPALALLVATACGNEGDAADSADRWPLSEIEAPADPSAESSNGDTSVVDASERRAGPGVRPPDEAGSAHRREPDGSPGGPAPTDAGVESEPVAAPHALYELPDSLQALPYREMAAATDTPRLGMGSDAVDTEASGPLVHTPREALEDFPGARFPRPEHVRGLYVNAWAAGSTKRMSALLDLARRTEINSLVIDIKDASGYVSHDTDVVLAREVGATEERRIGDLPALLERLEAEGIYPIARIVMVKDPVLSAGRPDLAIQDTAGGIWIDSKEIVWLNPYSSEVWKYHVDLAREVAEMGFPEIQWDYIRFPDAPRADLDRAVFPGGDGIPRAAAIRGFLSYARESLSDLPVRSTADVFGVTTSFNRDIGLGQLWESFIDVVDVALPMVYPSHYWEGSFGYSEPNAYPYEVVRAALRDALRRSERVEGAGLTRPWIQDFTLGAPVYGAAEVRAQIQAAYDVGIREWILWNPSTRYSESALEPVEGFETEPLVRVAGLLTPVSRRHVVIDSVAALPPAPDPLELLDTLAVDTVEVDPPEDVDAVDAPSVDSASVTDSVDAQSGDSASVTDSVDAQLVETVPVADTVGPDVGAPTDTLDTEAPADGSGLGDPLPVDTLGVRRR